MRSHCGGGELRFEIKRDARLRHRTQLATESIDGAAFEAVPRDEKFARNRFVAGAHGEVLEGQSFRSREELGGPRDVPSAVRRLPWRDLHSMRSKNFRPGAIGSCLRPGGGTECENDGVRRNGKAVARRLELRAPVSVVPRKIHQSRTGSEFD